MSNDQDSDEEDSKDNALRRRVEEQSALKTLRLTREKDSPFSIAMSDGSEITDKRPMKSATEDLIEGDGKTAANKALRLNVYQQARVNLLKETFGVDARIDGGMLEYFKTIHGREVSLLKLDPSEEGLKMAEESLRNFCVDSHNLLMSKFGVTFRTMPSLDGEESKTIKSGEALESDFRQPGLIELDALGEALAVSDPAHLAKSGGQSLKVCFLTASKNDRPVSLTIADDLIELHIHPEVTTAGNDVVHEIAKFFVEALAEITVCKAINASMMLPVNCSQLIASFRSGLAERTRLLREDPETYMAIKELDQWEINQHYGCMPGGASNKIRLPNGRLVLNKTAAQSEVQRFEASKTD